jgi:predicted GH43/DUF377 family glycosyl hydrolase
MLKVKRSLTNPILWPEVSNEWESGAVFNGCPVVKDNKKYLIYRAESESSFHPKAQAMLKTSRIGIAEKSDCDTYINRRILIEPSTKEDMFGCEDPRVTFFEGRYYIFYTALSTYPFGPTGIKVAVAVSKDLETIEFKKLVTPFNAKAMVLFPERINGKIVVMLTANTDIPPSKIAFAEMDNIEDLWNDAFWVKWYGNLEKNSINLLRSDQDHIEVGAVPLKTDKGWLVIYSYIRNYFSDQRVLGIEGILLDEKDYHKVIGRTDYALMVPETEYEVHGDVPMVVFPSGLELEGDSLVIHYGAGDSSCCKASVSLKELLRVMTITKKEKITLQRYKKNPILAPDIEHSWESKAVFNPAAIYIEGKVHILYRAMSDEGVSTMGYAISKDGIHIDERLEEPVYVARADFEKAAGPSKYSGCEDPRLTILGDTIYMLYTAYDGVHHPRIAFTSITKKDFLDRQWNWKMPVLISPPGYDNKDACLLPHKIGENYLLFHRMGIDVDIALVESLDFDGQTWLREGKWLKHRPGMWDGLKVGISGTALKIDEGWILIYHGVSAEDYVYRVGALLLDKKNPVKILARSYFPLFEPEMWYELHGQVPNVVFPCGNVLIGDTVYVYYGGGDTVIGLATITVSDILKSLS